MFSKPELKFAIVSAVFVACLSVLTSGCSRTANPAGKVGTSFHQGSMFWKVGTARTVITPAEPLWMAGYSARTRPAEGKANDLFLKAIAFEDLRGHRAVVVSADLLAIRGSLYQKCLPRLKQEFGLDPSQILLTASHTHCGPALPNRLGSLSAFDEANRFRIQSYCADLEDKIIKIVGSAIADLSPARLAGGRSEVDFAANRRNNPESERPQRAKEGRLIGPVDHSVPVMAAYRPDGALKAVIFGYACHNTTLTPAFYQWSGDYAGYAQAEIEKTYPQATALFVLGCAGDQDPVTRGGVDLAQRYGEQLAFAVKKGLSSGAVPLAGPLLTTMETVALNLGDVPSEEELKALAKSQTSYVRRWADNLLADIKSGKPLERTWPYPVQVWRFGERQLFVTLGGEPVVDYSIKFKREFGPNTWVVGYANDVMCYIPSLRVLNEDKPPLASPNWGYEGSQALKVLGLPANRWADDVEDMVTDSVRRLVAQHEGRPGK